jgi:hypothetical protein
VTGAALAAGLLVGLSLLLPLRSATCRATEIVTFDFETVAPGSDYQLLELEARGIRLTIGHQNSVAFAVSERIDGPQFDAGHGLRALSAFNDADGSLDPGAFIVDFSPPVSRVSVDMGDFGEDDDWLQLEAYAGPRGTGPLVARHSSLLVGGGDRFSFATLSAEGASLQSLVMIGGSPVFPNSVFYDNIRVTAIPEPASWLILSLGVWGLIGWGTGRK